MEHGLDERHPKLYETRSSFIVVIITTKMTFGMILSIQRKFLYYRFSHDEVVHGKCSLLGKMPGDAWQKFANLRAYYGYMWGYPGKKLLFMGNEFAQGREWNYEESLDWFLLDENHGGLWHKRRIAISQRFERNLSKNAPLFELDGEPEGFDWLVVE